jgi:hypothetical protein
MHFASEKGLVELVKALVESGADVHAKDKYGYGRPLHRGRRTLLLIRMVRCGHMLAVQVDGAASCLREGPDGDGAGAVGIGCGRARQGQPRVRSGAASWAKHLAFESDGAMRAHACCAGGRRCTMPQRRALWSW